MSTLRTSRRFATRIAGLSISAPDNFRSVAAKSSLDQQSREARHPRGCPHLSDPETDAALMLLANDVGLARLHSADRSSVDRAGLRICNDRSPQSFHGAEQL